MNSQIPSLPTFIIRNYRNDDFIEIDKLWEETEMGGAFRGDNKEIVRKSIKSGGKLIVLENTSNQEIIGTSWLTNDSRRIYLHHFCIKPKYQGKGFSHKLARASIEFAKEKKMQIKLEVHKENVIALSLYEKYGFKYLGDYLVYIIRDL